MNAIFNDILQDVKNINLEISNRSFQYGDGLFETIIVQGSNILFFEHHLNRLFKGMKKLGMQNREKLTENLLRNNILRLTEANQLEGTARVKLQVWRKPGGLYTPQDNGIDYLLTTVPFVPYPIKYRKVDFCKSIALIKTPFSKFKTVNSLPYILASIEREERKLDDLIILDRKGHISECISSNLFWKKGNRFYTPSTDTGCIGGVMRKVLIKELKSKGFEVSKVMAKPPILLAADKLFSCNVAGIYPVSELGSKQFDADLDEILDTGRKT